MGNDTWQPRTYHLNTVPIIFDDQMASIWEASVQVGVVNGTVACDQRAMDHLEEIIGSTAVTIPNAEAFWNRTSDDCSVSIENYSISFGILHKPVISATYMATTYTLGPSWMR